MADPLEPDPSPPQSPRRPSGRAGSASSSAGSSTSNGAAAPADFTAGPGPGFSAEDGAPAPGAGPETELEPELAGYAAEVELEQIESFLLTIGDGLHAAIGLGDLDWAMTEADLARIAPPATRIVNRYPTLQRVAGHSDAAALSIGMGLYTWRSLLERQAVLRARQRPGSRPAGAAPVSGPASQAPPAANTGPAPPMRAPDDVQTVWPDVGPQMPEGYVPLADRLRETRAPDSPEDT